MTNRLGTKVLIRKMGLISVAGIAAIFMFATDSQAAIPSGERAALIALYNDTDGDNWDDNSEWKGNNDEPDGFSRIGSEGDWFGITVSDDHVTRVDLGSNNLKGSIPAELGNLSRLSYLYLYNNQLTGALPSQLGNLSNLERLFLSGNQLSGTIPLDLGNLSSLEFLHLDENQLWGCIPASLGNLSGLKYLKIDHNDLSGEIPTELMNLTSLVDNSSDFRYNHLYTTSEDLRDFLNQKQEGGDWESSQAFDTAIPRVEPGGHCGGYTPCFSSIQAAMAATTPPSVIFVAGGDYPENVTVEEGFTLYFNWTADFSCSGSIQPVVISGPAGP